MDLSGIVSALRSLPGDRVEHHLCDVCCELLSVSGAALTLTAGVPPGLLGSSDATAAVIEDLQVTLGEGPTVDAGRLGVPVGEPDLAASRHPRWLAFRDGAAAAGAAAVFAFPLRIGAVQVGVLTLYQRRRGALSDEQHSGALAIAGVLAHTLLAIQAQAPPGVVADALGALAEHGAEVHQAAGMIAVRLGTPVGDALVLLRARAYGDDRTLAETAREVVAGRLSID
ncbi:MAG TPA: GAF and ANTAR domain-containing protein [Acidimicrobiales bacterium]|nr:GAF and ANTAR domain-containing protein [Acidimicrobiales bacterium]